MVLDRFCLLYYYLSAASQVASTARALSIGRYRHHSAALLCRSESRKKYATLQYRSLDVTPAEIFIPLAPSAAALERTLPRVTALAEALQVVQVEDKIRSRMDIKDMVDLDDRGTLRVSVLRIFA
jgi:hypothetical protein